MPLGLLHPKNVAPETGQGVKEGYIRVDSSLFRVVEPNRPQNPGPNFKPRAPFVALSWRVTRLDENLSPITDENDSPKTDTIDFSLGGSTLNKEDADKDKLHPAKADSPEDEEKQDLGRAAGTEGPTLVLLDSTFKINGKSGVHALFESLDGKVDEKFLDRVWAPDWDGMVCYIKARQSGENNTITGDDGVARQFAIKYVDKVVSMGKAKSAGKAATNGKPDEAALSVLKPILQSLSGENDGQKLTFKALTNKVSAALKKTNVDAKLHLPVLALVKNEGWLANNGHLFDMTVDGADQTIIFGELAS